MVTNLKTLATRSGVHIIAGGGYYREPYPPAVIDRTEEEWRKMFATSWIRLGIGNFRLRT